jgi:O-antigen ligase
MFDARRRHWYFLTAFAFLSFSYWIFVFLFICLLVSAKKKEINVISLYFFLILALPLLPVDLPGFGGIRFLVEVNYLRVAAVVLLLPICLKNWKNKDRKINKLFLCDFLLSCYVLLTIVLRFREDDLIGVLRYVVYSMVDIIIPYYAISRSLQNISDFKEVFASFALNGTVIAVIAIFEFAKRWLVYTSMGDALHLDVTVSYLDRGDFLRAMVTSGQPIVLGYDLIAVLGAIIFLKSNPVSKWRYLFVIAAILLGEIASLSKGPWVGVVLMAIAFLITDNQGAKKISYALAAIALIAVVLLNTEFGAKAIEYLPFVGNLDEGSMSYRQLLLDKSLQAVSDHPWFGSTDYLDQMEELRQGQGIIDLVNTYLTVALDSGLVGLALFAGYFLVMFAKIYKAARSYPRGSEEESLGRALFAIMLGLLFVLVSCSPISHIPAIYVAFSALALSYHRTTGKLRL